MTMKLISLVSLIFVLGWLVRPLITSDVIQPIHLELRYQTVPFQQSSPGVGDQRLQDIGDNNGTLQVNGDKTPGFGTTNLGAVQVNGYYRRNGTYVHGYNRRH